MIVLDFDFTGDSYRQLNEGLYKLSMDFLDRLGRRRPGASKNSFPSIMC